jgi:murein L,D-transpeptidase YafK
MSDDMLRRLCLLAVSVLIGVMLPGCGSSDAPAAALASPDPTVDPDSSVVRVVVQKAKRRMFLFRPGMPAKSYRIALGSEPDGDKQRQGDGRTPVGTFYVCGKNDQSKYYLFIALSYPNEEHASRGLDGGLITQDQHDAILDALAAHKTPPWYTRLGGEIGFHGGGASWDWTRGCIALENADMRELYASIRTGASVTIEP